MNKIDDYLLLNILKYDLTDAAYNFHLEPNEDTEKINLNVEFSFADVDQVLDDTVMKKFSSSDDLIALPSRILVNFVEGKESEENPPFCEGQFIGSLIFKNEEKINITLEEFQEFILNHSHELSLLIWTHVREIFQLYIKDKHFPELPETFEKQEN